MNGPRIPDRAPLGDPFSGALLLVNGVYLLAHRPYTAEPVQVHVIDEGVFTIRYGVRFLEKHHRSIVPGLLALDYGDILTGERAWTLIYQRGNRYPRADVIGYTNLGEDEMLPLKVLDIDVPPQVLVYAGTEAIQPIASVDALIMPQEVVVPPRLTDYLPCFDSLEAWAQAHIAGDDPGKDEAEGRTE